MLALDHWHSIRTEKMAQLKERKGSLRVLQVPLRKASLESGTLGDSAIDIGSDTHSGSGKDTDNGNGKEKHSGNEKDTLTGNGKDTHNVDERHTHKGNGNDHPIWSEKEKASGKGKKEKRIGLWAPDA